MQVTTLGPCQSREVNFSRRCQLLIDVITFDPVPVFLLWPWQQGLYVANSWIKAIFWQSSFAFSGTASSLKFWTCKKWLKVLEEERNILATFRVGIKATKVNFPRIYSCTSFRAWLGQGGYNEFGEARTFVLAASKTSGTILAEQRRDFHRWPNVQDVSQCLFYIYVWPIRRNCLGLSTVGEGGHRMDVEGGDGHRMGD